MLNFGKRYFPPGSELPYLWGMDELIRQINNYRQEIESENGLDAETFRIKWLGTKGMVKTLMGEMKNVAPENKKEAGQLLNDFKLFTEQHFENLKSASEIGRAHV